MNTVKTGHGVLKKTNGGTKMKRWSRMRTLGLIACMLLTAAALFATGGAESGTAEPAEPKVFTYAISQEPPTIDPQLNSSGDGLTINSNLFEGLVRSDEMMQPVPAVATHWDISDDGLVYTFYLREDAHWKDGSPITAEDFVYSWTRVLDPNLGAKYANQMFYIKNGEAIYNGEMSPDQLGVEIIDDHTLEVTLEAPTLYIMEMFARNVFAPIDKDTVEANPEDWMLHPETCMSNGPFVLKDYAVNEHFILEKDPNYWNADAINVDEIHFVFIGDSGTSFAAFNAGEIDGTASFPSAETPSLMLNSDELHIRPRLSTLYVVFNTQVAPLDNPDVREALSKAIDRQLIIDSITMGGELPASGFVPPNMTVEGQDFRETAGDYGISATAMVEEAQSILAEAGYPNGEGWPAGVELVYADSATTKAICEALQEMWKTNLNITIELVAVESRVQKARRNDGEFMITTSGWGADYAYPMTFLDMWVDGSGTNYANYDNPEFDRLISAAKATSNTAEAADLLYEAEAMMIGRDHIIAPLNYRSRLILMKDYTSGWYIDTLGKYYFMYVDVDE